MNTPERYSAGLAPWTGAFGSFALSKEEGKPVSYDSEASPAGDPWKEETWLDLLKAEMERNGDSLTNIQETSGFEPDKVPDYNEAGWTAWTFERVYFPEVYDGQYSVRSVSRDPNNQITQPVGGGN